MNIKIRNATEKDLDEVVRVNNQFEGQIFIRSKEDFKILLKECKQFYVAVDEEENVLGYLTVLDERSNYSEEMFDWFKSKFDHFLYAQQIAVDRNMQNKGIGTNLYRYLIEQTDPTYSVIYCDLFIEPVNVQSYNFHTKLGFKQIDSLRLKDWRILGIFELKRNKTIV